MNIINENYVDSYSDVLVSVFCTAFNHEKYIKDTLEGFVNQKTTFAFEVIVHDDASTDKTADIIREYQNRYPDIIRPVFQTENQYSKGISIISSILIPLSKGKYFAFCEGDDFWCDCNKLQSQVEILEKEIDYVACVHNSEFFSVSSGKKKVFYDCEDKVLGVRDCVMQGGQSFHTSSILVRREIFCNAPGFVSLVKGVGDYPKAVYYSLCGPIYYIGKVMSVYRVGSEGSWSIRQQANLDKDIKTHESINLMLEKADLYSNNNYHDLFLEAIENNEYYLSKARGEYKKVVRSKRCFSHEKLLRKIIYIIYAAFPISRVVVDKIKGTVKNGQR